MCVHRRVFEDGIFYTLAEQKLEGLSDLFPDDDIEIFIGLRNPATFIPAHVRGQQRKQLRQVHEWRRPRSIYVGPT